MIDFPFLQKITPPSCKWRRKRIDGSRKISPTSKTTQEEIAAEHRRQNISHQLVRISGESYNEGVSLVKDEKYDDARECFENALASRLVLYGPESERLLEVHGNLRRIACIQGDTKKAAHHKLKISHIQSLMMRNMVNKENIHDTVDWSVLLK